MLLIRILVRLFHTNHPDYSSNKYINREGRFINKLLSRDGLKSNQNLVNETKTIKPHVNRRVTVLNKLFMKYITDLMITGSSSPDIIGRGIEISRVKTANDFQLVNVYWFSSNSNLEELNKTQAILDDYAYKLRRELCLLKVIGIVPPIKFSKDRQMTKIIELDKAMTNADYGDEYTPAVKHVEKPSLTLFTKLPENIKENLIKQNTCDSEADQADEATDEIADDEDDDGIYDIDLPPMRHDAFGLNRLIIMDKIKKPVNKFSVESNGLRENDRSSESYSKEEMEAFTEFLNQRNIQWKKQKKSELENFQREKFDLDVQLNNRDIN